MGRHAPVGIAASGAARTTSPTTTAAACEAVISVPTGTPGRVHDQLLQVPQTILPPMIWDLPGALPTAAAEVTAATASSQIAALPERQAAPAAPPADLPKTDTRPDDAVFDHAGASGWPTFVFSFLFRVFLFPGYFFVFLPYTVLTALYPVPPLLHRHRQVRAVSARWVIADVFVPLAPIQQLSPSKTVFFNMARPRTFFFLRRLAPAQGSDSSKRWRLSRRGSHFLSE